MSFIKLQILLLLTLAHLTISIQQTCNETLACPQHSACSLQFKLCLCDQGYISSSCNISTVELNAQPLHTNLSSSVIAYYTVQPIQHNIYLQITLSLCQVDTFSPLTVYHWFQNEGYNQYTPATSFSPIRQSFQQNCTNIIFSQYYFQAKSNGETQRLILGITSNTTITLSLQVRQRKQIVIYISYYATILVIILLLLSFFGSVVLAICRRNRVMQFNFTTNQTEEEYTHDIQYFQEYLPKRALAEIMKEENVVCPICLQTIQNKQIVRQTPCQHIFHSSCLDSWCIKNISCPVCRTDLAEDYVRAVKESLLQMKKVSKKGKCAVDWEETIEMQISMSDKAKFGAEMQERIL